MLERRVDESLPTIGDDIDGWYNIVTISIAVRKSARLTRVILEKKNTLLISCRAFKGAEFTAQRPPFSGLGQGNHRTVLSSSQSGALRRFY